MSKKNGNTSVPATKAANFNLASKTGREALKEASRAPRKGKKVDAAPQQEPNTMEEKVAIVTENEVVAPVVDVAVRKIEKDRPEQNGVKQPSAGGACRAVWDFCTAASAETLVTAAQVKAQALAANWNPNNAMIEYYNWRKFMGIRGRQAKVAVPAEA